MKPFIEVKNLSVVLSQQKILNDISVSIDKGDVVAVLGPNGSGKTTFIRALLGMIPYEGSVSFGGKRIGDVLDTVGYVSQQFNFDRSIPMTVTEFLQLFSKRKESWRKLRHVLLEVDMKKQEQAQVGALSGGQYQRLLIARALLNDPSILILDEAISEVDMAGTKGFYDIIAHQKKIHRTTVILVSHEVNMIYRFADQIICLNRELICMGTPKDTITKNVLEKLYGQDVKMHDHDQ